MPSSPTHPVIFLPLPDPSSFPHLVHYMYFGQTTYLEDCLNRKVIKWEGVVRNVEYLGMRTEIKVFLGRWYGNWMAPSHLRTRRRPPCVLEDEESDDGDEAGGEDSDESDSSDSDEMSEDDAGEPEPIGAAPRGRSRAPRYALRPDSPCPAPGMRSL